MDISAVVIKDDLDPPTQPHKSLALVAVDSSASPDNIAPVTELVRRSTPNLMPPALLL
jgi:hypothetical protein